MLAVNAQLEPPSPPACLGKGNLMNHKKGVEVWYRDASFKKGEADTFLTNIFKVIMFIFILLSSLGWGGNCIKCLKRGWNEKMGWGNINFKKGKGMLGKEWVP